MSHRINSVVLDPLRIINHVISACVNIGRGVNIVVTDVFYIMLSITSCIDFDNYVY